MKTSKLMLIGIFGVQIFLSSCSKIYIYEISKFQSLSTDNTKSAIVVGLEGVSGQ